MIIASFLIPLVLLVIVLKIISLPIKLIIKFVFNSILGGIVLAICAFFGIGITIYWYTIALTGLFGIPGLFIAIVIAFFIA